MTAFTHASTNRGRGERGLPGKPGGRGRTAWYWKSVWKVSINYQVDDVVRYQGKVYIALNENKASTPPSQNWELVISDGQDGQSIRGDKGDEGKQGTKGDSIRGDKGDQGKPGIGFRFRAAWSHTVSYQVNDIVTYKGNTYVATATSIHQAPQPGSYWEIFCARGDTGLQGNQGIQGIQGNAGKDGTSFIFRQRWSASTQYHKNDVVTWEGSSWIALTDCIGQEPPAASWDCLASIGQSGPRGLTSLAGRTNPGGVIAAGTYAPKIHNRVTIGDETYEFDVLQISETDYSVPSDVYLYFGSNQKISLQLVPWIGLTVRGLNPGDEFVYVGCVKGNLIWNRFNRDPQVVKGFTQVLTGEPTAVCMDGVWSIVDGYQEFASVSNGVIL